MSQVCCAVVSSAHFDVRTKGRSMRRLYLIRNGRSEKHFDTFAIVFPPQQEATWSQASLFPPIWAVASSDITLNPRLKQCNRRSDQLHISLESFFWEMKLTLTCNTFSWYCHDSVTRSVWLGQKWFIIQAISCLSLHHSSLSSSIMIDNTLGKVKSLTIITAKVYHDKWSRSTCHCVGAAALMHQMLHVITRAHGLVIRGTFSYVFARNSPYLSPCVSWDALQPLPLRPCTW